jgi:16S rRNA processing protein RimM
MKSISRADFIDIGTVQKSHGTKGEVKLIINENVQLKKWAFLEFQGKPVPFYIEHISGSKEEPIIKLEGIESPAISQQLQGKNVLYPANLIKTGKAKKVGTVIGYRLIDRFFGEIGVLEAIQELPHQTMLVCHYKGKEVLIPAVDDFIMDIDSRKKTVLMNLPEGFLEI